MNDFKGRWKTLTREVKMPVVISEYLGRKKKNNTSNIFTMGRALFATSRQCNLSVKLLDGNKCHRT